MKIPLLIAAVAALTFPSTVIAEEAAKFVAQGHVWVDGDSTLHRYHLDARTFDASMTVADGAADLLADIRAKRVTSLGFSVRVGALSSGETGLDENLRKALKADAHPLITFNMQSFDVKDASNFILHGKLEVAGVARDIALPVGVANRDGALHFTGKVPLRMTDFEVQPPVLMLGTLKTADAVDVGYDLTFAPPAPKP